MEINVIDIKKAQIKEIEIRIVNGDYKTIARNLADFFKTEREIGRAHV